MPTSLRHERRESLTQPAVVSIQEAQLLARRNNAREQRVLEAAVPIGMGERRCNASDVDANSIPHLACRNCDSTHR